MSTKRGRVQSKNQRRRRKRAFRLGERIASVIVKDKVATTPATTPMERFFIGVSHEMGFEGKVNDEVRDEVARRLKLLEEPNPQQRWNWTEAELSKEQFELLPEGDRPDKIMICELYEVWMRKFQPEGWPIMWWLSIKRRFTKEPIHDWRHLQKIKNELVGEDNEGVELYPSEKRLVDTSNQYHLFVMADPAERFPFGFQQRAVATQSMLGAEQRAFDD